MAPGGRLDGSMGHPPCRRVAPACPSSGGAREGQELYKISRATVWNWITRYELGRYNIPARGKKTLLKRSELARAVESPVQIQPRRKSQGKAAA